MPETLAPREAAALAAIAELLRQRRGIDLGIYKRPYVERRVLTRMRRLGLPGLAAYRDHLAAQESEAEALIGVLTIGVTGFFRNPTTWAQLEREIYPRLFGAPGSRRPVRLWSMACASGEEPWSAALQLYDQAPWRERFSILATDISGAALARAREGRYDGAALAAVPARLREYCPREVDGFRIDEALRPRVRFRQMDVLGVRDYPRADLVLCRNLLIYLDRPRQQQVVERLAASQPRGGILVLGRAETLVGCPADTYRCLSTAERIYERI